MPKRKKVAKKVKSARSASTKPNGKALEAGAASKAKAANRSGSSKMSKKKAAPVPPQYGSATPQLVVSPCSEALDFYAKAFGAKVLLKMPGPDGLIMHAEMKIGDSIVMLSDEMQMPGLPATRKTPKNLGATTGGVMLYVKDVDGFVERAVGAGATTVMPLADQFWGDRYGQIEDPYGHVWAVATRLRDMTPKQMQKAMALRHPNWSNRSKQMGAPEA